MSFASWCADQLRAGREVRLVPGEVLPPWIVVARPAAGPEAWIAQLMPLLLLDDQPRLDAWADVELTEWVAQL